MQKFCTSLLVRIAGLKHWQAALLIAVIGFAVFFTGLTNAFQGDDSLQIVSNVPVHSISNIRIFFEGGTFYDGSATKLTGIYYRPLMTTVFSLIYTLFGPNAFYFHFVQLLLCIGSSIILYLFLRFSFKPLLALFLALLFLVHPVDSEVVYSIPCMQDALFMFFGILGFYLLFKYKSIKSLMVVALCLLLSLLSKETGLLFVAMSLIYLFWFSRKRLWAFMGIMVLPVGLWFVLKIHAIGLSPRPTEASIDQLGLGGRLLTDPSVVLLYITKLVIPIKLASAYFWVYPRYTVVHTLLPLVVDVAVLLLVGYLGFRVHARATKSQFSVFVFFAIWTAAGLLLILQIIPLDMTASETWVYFSMVGMLGMLGVTLVTLMPIVYLYSRITLIGMIVIVLLLGTRTALRGLDWDNSYTLGIHDLATSKDDYNADYQVAVYYYNQNDYQSAEVYAERSVAEFPNALNEAMLGADLGDLGDFSMAHIALTNALKYNPTYYTIYDDLAGLTLYTGKQLDNEQLLISFDNKLPHDSTIWFYTALMAERYGYNTGAQTAITQAAEYGQIPQAVYQNIMDNQSFYYHFGNNPPVNIPSDSHTLINSNL
jgi:hypothetical protein